MSNIFKLLHNYKDSALSNTLILLFIIVLSFGQPLYIITLLVLCHNNINVLNIIKCLKIRPNEGYSRRP